MVKLIQKVDKQKFAKVNLFDLYLAGSFILSFCLWFGLYFSKESFFDNGVATSALLLGNYLFFVYGKGYSHYLKETVYFPGLFIFQSLCFLGISFVQGFSEGLFLSLVPTGVGLFFYMKFDTSWSYTEDREKRERFFYHDLINQTHGLSLFLNHRINCNQGLSPNECALLVDEVRTIQSLVKDHYGLGHKNLSHTYEFVEFDKGRSSFIHLIENFLPSHFVETHLIFKGYLDQSFNDKKNNLIHYPSVYRILGNLVKNIAENKARAVEIIFDYDEEGFSIETKNKVFKLKDVSENLAESLSDIILSEKELKDKTVSGYGLGSISSLCEELGGRFDFAIEEEYWVNRVFLPIPEVSKNEDLCESNEEIKKAA